MGNAGVSPPVAGGRAHGLSVRGAPQQGMLTLWLTQVMPGFGPASNQQIKKVFRLQHEAY